ncbi:hypothetical protein LCM20_19900 [Halobacillus litoralis]|uniref:hypothetical protein n=1 Tax=Halobacillus litoralis TaxID=45668 RepID=UPI001CD4C7DC|nr:hypothetical protein [Halobacillus litoralis]MCA0972851.1 hypothetical protein [Halobacillus litoralis]
MSLSGKLTSIFILSSVVLMTMLVTYQTQEVTTSGVFVVKQKLQEDHDYFLLLEDQKIEVTRNEYQLVEENRRYAVSFVWNRNTPYRGELYTIEPIER